MARYGADLVSIPGLGGLAKTFKQSVKGTDVAVGAMLSLAGIYGVKYIQNKFLAGKLPELVLRATPAIAGLATAGALYYTETKFMKGPNVRSRAIGHAVGAISAGFAINALNELKVQFPMLADIVDLRLAGVVIDDPNRQLGAYGLAVDDPRMSGLSDLAALDMGLGGYGDASDDIDELMGV